MYEKNTKILCLLTAMFLILFFHAYAGMKEETVIHTEEKKNPASGSTAVMKPQQREVYSTSVIAGKPDSVTSRARVIEEETLIHYRIASLTDSDLEVLCRIVQAEAGGEDFLGKQMVADVIINRVCSKKFPNSITGVVFQENAGQSQFSPVDDGRYHSVKISDSTREAVEAAIYGEDTTDGALYFVAAKKAAPDRLAWFQNSLLFLKEHGGHQFYK